jgi:hypothetical protein
LEDQEKQDARDEEERDNEEEDEDEERQMGNKTGSGAKLPVKGSLYWLVKRLSFLS